MPHIAEDRVLETTTTTGTGALALGGALTGFRTFASVCAVNDTVHYYLEAVDANGVTTGDWETGLGTYSAASTLTRTTVIRSSNANAAVAFAAGAKRVGIAALATRLLQLDNSLAAALPLAAADPPTPPSGLRLYALGIAGQAVLKRIGPSGVDTPIQDSLAFNNFAALTPGTGTTPSALSVAVTSVGTISHPAPAATNLGTEMRRIVNTSAATAAALASTRANTAMVLRSANAGRGGYRLVLRFKLDTLAAGNRGFFGLSSNIAAPTNVDPLTSTADQRIGFAFAANTGNLTLIHADGAAAPTQIALGASFPVDTTTPYELVLFCAPAATGVGYRCRNMATGAAVSGTISTNQPAAATFLAPLLWMTNNATAAAVAWSLYKWTLESDQ